MPFVLYEMWLKYCGEWGAISLWEKAQQVVCIYQQDTKEIELRKWMISFAVMLRLDDIVAPPSNGIIPATRYVKTFGYTFDKKSLQRFKNNKRQFNNQCLDGAIAKNKERVDTLRLRIGNINS